MSALGLSPLARLAEVGPLAARVIVGIVMFAHGYQKITMIGPAKMGTGLADLGVPFPIFMGYVVTWTETIGGALLVLGLLSRFAALALTVNLTVAILLAHLHDPLIPSGPGQAYVAYPLVLIGGFLVVLFSGPGALSVDRAVGIEPKAPPAPAPG